MSEGNGKTIIAIVLVVAIIGAFYLWYTGGSLGSLGGGGAQYQSAGGIAPMGGGGGGGKKGTDWGAALMPLALTGALGSGALYYLQPGRKTALKLEPQTGRIADINNGSIKLTAELKYGGMLGRNPYRERIKFSVQHAEEGSQTEASVSPGEKLTDWHGKAETTLKAGGDRETVTVKAVFKGIIRREEATSAITIGEEEHPPRPEPAPSLDAIKGIIKEKIAQKAQARFNLRVPQSRREQFKNCVIGKLNAGRARDITEDIISAIRAQTNPPRTDHEILNLPADTAQFDNALDRAFNAMRLDQEITANESGIRACAGGFPEGYSIETKTQPTVVDYMTVGDKISVFARVTKDGAPVGAKIKLEVKSKGSDKHIDKGKRELPPTQGGWSEFSFPVVEGQQTVITKAKAEGGRVKPNKFSLIGIREDAKELKELLDSMGIKVMASELKDYSAIITIKKEDWQKIKSILGKTFRIKVEYSKKKELAKVKIKYGQGNYLKLFQLLAKCKTAG